MIHTLKVIYIRGKDNWRLLAALSPSISDNTRLCILETISICGFGYQILDLALTDIEPELTAAQMLLLLEDQDIPF